MSSEFNKRLENLVSNLYGDMQYEKISIVASSVFYTIMVTLVSCSLYVVSLEIIFQRQPPEMHKYTLLIAVLSFFILLSFILKMSFEEFNQRLDKQIIEDVIGSKIEDDSNIKDVLDSVSVIQLASQLETVKPFKSPLYDNVIYRISKGDIVEEYSELELRSTYLIKVLYSEMNDVRTSITNFYNQTLKYRIIHSLIVEEVEDYLNRYDIKYVSELRKSDSMRNIAHYTSKIYIISNISRICRNEINSSIEYNITEFFDESKHCSNEVIKELFGYNVEYQEVGEDFVDISYYNILKTVEENTLVKESKLLNAFHKNNLAN